jgi:hypothetical protein
MGTEIREPIKVGAVFDRSQVTPAWFVWGGRRYAVRDVTQRWQTREGSTPILHLGVTDGSSCFELTFNQHTLLWLLASVEANGCE